MICTVIIEILQLSRSFSVKYCRTRAIRVYGNLSFRSGLKLA